MVCSIRKGTASIVVDMYQYGLTLMLQVAHLAFTK